MQNDERMHHYQRGRKSITGLRLEIREIIETERLVEVAWRGLFCFFFNLLLVRASILIGIPCNT